MTIYRDRENKPSPLAAKLLLLLAGAAAYPADDERVCPTVKAIRHLHLHDVSQTGCPDADGCPWADRSWNLKSTSW
ncbi:Malate synthase [Frankliniella fusca]|uniref:Malate synthase n=1 Tax=Frankliniella fusca TaxID=407009 RepID=A0AAE1HWI1_9NEOP|nr:Malate synthase [Frankliniella fusca]